MKRKLSVIIAAHNEARTIGPLVRRLLLWRRHPEVVVIANGCTDGTARIAKIAGARVVRFHNRLGPDVGRAIGLAIAKGDMYLVLDADMLVTLAQLEPFVRAIERGTDVALNQYPFIGTKKIHHPTAVAKQALNVFADRADLRAASLTAVPHALSHRAVKKLGPLAFCVPPVAQARALCMNLRVEMAGRVPVGLLNRERGPQHEAKMRRLILGDCLEGMAVLIAERGTRGGFTDLGRQRHLLQSAPIIPRKRVDTVAVIPTQGEASVKDVIKQLRKASIDQIRLVVNGVEEAAAEAISRQRKIAIDYYREAVGHDVGRALGCMQVDSAKYFVTDADIPIRREDVKPFLDALDGGKVDIALNQLDAILPKVRQTDAPSIVKRFLNIACERSDLGVSSLTAVPHAVSERVIQKLGADAFAVPPVAQVKALLAGFGVEAVHPVDVVRTNAVRPHLHHKGAGRPLQKLIIGDYLEAVAHLQSVQGERANFPDNVRRRDIAAQYIMGRRSLPARVSV